LEGAERMSPAPEGSGFRLDGALDLLARMVMVGAVCFLMSWGAIVLTRTSGSVAAIWPASAILLAVLLRSRPAHWPCYLFAGYLAGCGANLIYGDDLLIAAGLAFGNVVETIVAAILLRRCFPQGVDLREIRQLAGLVVIGMLAAAACGAVVLDSVHSGNFWRTWFNWWTAVGTAVLLIVPVILAWRPVAGEDSRIVIERPGESALAILCAALGMALLFNQPTVSLLYAICPLLIWAALRLGVFVTATVCLVIAAVAVPLASFGYGPLAALDLALDLQLRLLQTFLAVVTLTSLSVAIALQRREEVEYALRNSEQRFRDFADSISDRFWETDEQHRFAWRLEPSERLRLWPSIIGKTRFELADVDPAQDPLWRKHLDDLNARRPFRDYRYSLRDPAGRLRFRSISGKPIYDRSGKFLGYRGTSTDITDNMETELLATRLGRVVDEALNEIYIVDVESHHFMFANRRARDNLGYSMDELREMTVLDLCPALNKDALLRNYTELDSRRQQSLIIETSYQRKNGSLYDVEAHLQRFDVSGLSPIYTLIVNDTTNRKRVHSELASKSALLQTTLDNMAQGLCVYDENLTLVGYNKKFIAFLGLPPDAVHTGSSYAENIEHFARHALGLSETGVAEYVMQHNAQARERFARRSLHRRLDGSIIASNRRPMPDGGFVTTFSDITERMQTEEALRLAAAELQEVKASFEAAILASRQILYEWNLGDNNIRWSGETAVFLGYAPEELGGFERFLRHVHPEDLDYVEREARHEEEIGVSFHLEYRLRHKNGHYVNVSDSGVYLAGRAGQAKRVVGFIADITTQKSAAESLRQSDKMLAIGQLTGGIAHDFNNLLAIVRGNLELLGEDLAEDSHLHKRVQTAMSAADRGAALTQRLLAFARKQPLVPQTTHINSLIVDMEDLMRRSLPATVAIGMTLAEDLWLTSIDPNGLESALLNLVLNARDAMPTGGKLTVETANSALDADYADNNEEITAGQYVMIAVTDTGTGMPPDVVARAFEPFFTTKPVGRGTGLGLSMVYGFAKQSGGHAKIYSELGHGTTVKLYLPRARGNTLTTMVEDELPVVQDSNNETILVVEDDALVRATVDRMLQELGYTVLLAATGEDALPFLESDAHIDLLFTDVVLPGKLGGKALAERARKLRPNLAVIYSSGYTQNSIIHQGRLDADVELLSKPYKKQDLARRLRSVLGRRKPA
jgi:PAS domain S-box-containing protein